MASILPLLSQLQHLDVASFDLDHGGGGLLLGQAVRACPGLVSLNIALNRDNVREEEAMIISARLSPLQVTASTELNISSAESDSSRVADRVVGGAESMGEAIRNLARQKFIYVGESFVCSSASRLRGAPLRVGAEATTFVREILVPLTGLELGLDELDTRILAHGVSPERMAEAIRMISRIRHLKVTTVREDGPEPG